MKLMEKMLELMEMFPLTSWMSDNRTIWEKENHFASCLLGGPESLLGLTLLDKDQEQEHPLQLGWPGNGAPDR